MRLGGNGVPVQTEMLPRDRVVRCADLVIAVFNSGDVYITHFCGAIRTAVNEPAADAQI